MKIKLLKHSLITTAVLFLTLTVYSQKFSDDLSNESLPGWFVKNNSYPLPIESNNWTNRGQDGYMGPIDGNLATDLSTFFLEAFMPPNPFDLNYPYAAVGYSNDDLDGATMSNWLISPVIHGMKNGDIIQFVTKAQSPDFSSRVASFYKMDITAFTECNRPNRLEVRLNPNATDDAPMVGTGIDDFGDFTIQLKVINPDLTVDGYPSDWTTITLQVSGLPQGQIIDGRIGFWYHFPNAGYNKCRTKNKITLPEEYAQMVIDHEVDKAAEEYPALGYAYKAANIIGQIVDLATDNQVGTNGSYIAVGKFKFIPSPGVYLRETFTNNVQYNGSSGFGWIDMGYQGSPKCTGRDFPYRPYKSFTLYNYSDTDITVIPAIEPGSNPDNFKLYENQKVTVKSGSGYTFNIDLVEGLVPGTGTGIFTLRDPNNLGGVLFGANLRYTIKPTAPPVAKCVSYSIDVTLPDSGFAAVTGRMLNNGSTNSCGDTTGIQLNVTKFNWMNWGDDVAYYGCNEVGSNTLYLMVEDVNGNSKCPVTVNVRGTAPVAPQNVVQKYYLKVSENAMAISNLVTPTFYSKCDLTVTRVSIQDQFNSNLNTPSSLGPGTYKIGWAATDKGGLSASGTTTLQVIDTIKPIAKCNAITNIGYIANLPGVGSYIRTTIEGKDLNPVGYYVESFDNVKLSKFQISTPWFNNSQWVDNIPLSCSNAGAQFPATLKVIDNSGNYATCQTTVKITRPDLPNCQNISIDLDQHTGFKTISPSDLLLNGGNGVCGINNATVSKFSFSCTDVNKVIPVTVSYYDATNVSHSCVSQVKVNQYSKVNTCIDTIYETVPDYAITSTHYFDPLLSSVCSSNLMWSASGTGSTTFSQSNITGGSSGFSLSPGITNITLITQYLDSTYKCSQTIMVKDNSKPIVLTTPTDVTVNLPSLSSCTYQHEVVNAYQQGSYSFWAIIMTGATNDSIGISPVYNNDYWKNQFVDLYPGSTKITLKAYDLAGNINTLSYNVNINAQTPLAPGVISPELNASHLIVGDFCGENYGFKIASPVNAFCHQKDYRWYFEVRDGYMGNIVYEKDSIPQDSGAVISIKIGPYYNQDYTRYVYLGYHDKQYGFKVLDNFTYLAIRDTIDKVLCPSDTTVISTNNTSYTYSYTVKPPANLCPGAFWGFAVSGATTYSTQKRANVAYNSNQQITMNGVNLSSAYPVIPADSVAVVQLNSGSNKIFIYELEQSGNFNSNGGCSYTVKVKDAATPVLNCAPDVTLHRTSTSSCSISVASAPLQQTGFAGQFGISNTRLYGSNPNVKLDKSLLPSSLSIVSTQSTLSYNDAYIEIPFNTSGTVTFNWEYQSAFPQYFNPFININNYNPKAYSQAALSGFNAANKTVQTGTFTATVSAGDVLFIGVTEGGASNGYLKISNFSAPYVDFSAKIPQPSFVTNPSVFFHSDIQPTYDLGKHTINYSLTDVNNGNVTNCTQQLTVIDDFASSLTCANQTLYLNSLGYADLKPQDIVSTCFPISATTLSKQRFTMNDRGTQNDTISSIDQTTGQTITCIAAITVLDTIRPTLVKSKLNVTLDYYNNGSISESDIRNCFYDMSGIKSVSASQTSFNCDDIGYNPITLTATDSSGNVASYQVNVQTYPLGYVIDEQNLTDSVCIGKNVVYCPKSGSINNPLNYHWYEKDTSEAHKSWDYFTCSPENEIIYNSSSNKFYNSTGYYSSGNTYMAYKDGTNINFRKLNIAKQVWERSIPTLEIPSTYYNPDSYYFNEINQYGYEVTPYVVYLDPSGACQIREYTAFRNLWLKKDSMIFWTSNQDFTTLYGNDGFYFPVKYNGVVFAGAVMVGAGAQYWNVYRPSKPSYSTYVRNAGNIVGVRNNTLNLNAFFSLTININGYIVGRDSLASDPTGNSALFSMNKHEDNAYIAYKSVNGKACVKKYEGSGSWSNVGNLDFSQNEIFNIDLASINDTLYVLYAEASNHFVVQKFDGSQWIEMESPNNNNINTTYSDNIKLFDMGGVPTFFTSYQSVPSMSRLVRNDGWKHVYPAACFNPNSSVAGVHEYRCMIGKNNCATFPSGITTLVVNAYPKLSINDTTLLNAGSTIITAKNSVGIVNWLSSPIQGKYIGGGLLFQTPYLTKDSVFYAYAQNGRCYSDTVQSHVFVNDVPIRNYAISFPDTLCSGEYGEIKLDSADYGFLYSLYEKQSDGSFIPTTDPYSDVTFGINPSKTTDYKIKVEEANLDAADYTMYNLGSSERFDFGKPSLPITNTITTEAWVFANNYTYAGYCLNMTYSNGGYYDAASTRNWEWSNNNFTVFNGNSSRSLTFPSFPYSNNWIHVATTAGPDGLFIYYNGVLVASSNDQSTVNINHAVAPLQYGLDASGGKSGYLSGFDEFQIWNTKRTASQIASDMNTCLTGSEQGLLIYNNFSKYNRNTHVFTSVVGNNAVVKDQPSSTVPQISRNGTCGDPLISQRFLPAVTVHVLTGQAEIIDSYNYYTTSTQCDGELVPFIAKASKGTITWYDQYVGGNIVGTGDTLRKFVTKDTVFYCQPQSGCQRSSSYASVNSYPQILKVYNDTICSGQSLGRANFNVDLSDNSEGVNWYDAITGGNQVDIRGGDGPGAALSQNDTLYGEAYNNYCSALERVPYIVYMHNIALTSYSNDTSLCNSGSVNLHATGYGGTIEWWWGESVMQTGENFTTPNLTNTSSYYVGVNFNDKCYSNYPRVTVNVNTNPVGYAQILACDSYTWIDGKTYTQSDSDIVYVKSNTTGCDSTLHLNLKIASIADQLVTVDKPGVCIGDSVLFTVSATEKGLSYCLRDTTNNSLIEGPIIADGSALSFTTGKLETARGFVVEATTKISNTTDTLSCSKQIGGVFTINVGTARSSSGVAACTSYFWNGKTYTQSGIYRDTLKAVMGCDSIAEINLTINQAKSSDTTAVAFIRYTWYRHEYLRSGDYSRFVMTNSFCDSVVTLHLTINHASCTWDGTQWNPALPTAIDNAIMDGDFADVGFDCFDFTINPGKHVTITDGILAVNGNMTIKSNALQGMGTFIDNALIMITGKTTVEQFITGQFNQSTGKPSGRFWYISSPLSSVTSSVYNAAGVNRMWSWNEPTHSYTEITDNSTALSVMHGYLAKVNKDTTIVFNGGNLNTGSMSLPVSYTDMLSTSGYVIAGNPYPSYLDWNAIYEASSNLYPTLWYRTANAMNQMVFDTYNALSQVGTNNNGVADVTQYIPPTQGFWVLVNNVQGTLNVDNSMRSHQSNDLLKSEIEPNKILRLKLADGNATDEHIIVINADAKNSFDEYDSPKMFATDSLVPQLYGLVDGQKLVIDGIASIDSSTTIPLFVNCKTAGTFTLSATEMNGLDSYELLLNDNLKHTSEPLLSGKVYPFTVSGPCDTARFSISLKSMTSETKSALLNTANIKVYQKENTIVVDLSEYSNTYQSVDVYDVLGQTLMSSAITGSRTILSGTFPTQVYMVKVRSKTGIYTTKLFYVNN